MVERDRTPRLGKGTGRRVDGAALRDRVATAGESHRSRDGRAVVGRMQYARLGNPVRARGLMLENRLHALGTEQFAENNAT